MKLYCRFWSVRSGRRDWQSRASCSNARWQKASTTPEFFCLKTTHTLWRVQVLTGLMWCTANTSPNLVTVSYFTVILLCNMKRGWVDKIGANFNLTTRNEGYRYVTSVIVVLHSCSCHHPLIKLTKYFFNFLTFPDCFLTKKLWHFWNSSKRKQHYPCLSFYSLQVGNVKSENLGLWE